MHQVDIVNKKTVRFRTDDNYGFGIDMDSVTLFDPGGDDIWGPFSIEDWQTGDASTQLESFGQIIAQCGTALTRLEHDNTEALNAIAAQLAHLTRQSLACVQEALRIQSQKNQ